MHLLFGIIFKHHNWLILIFKDAVLSRWFDYMVRHTCCISLHPRNKNTGAVGFATVNISLHAVFLREQKIEVANLKSTAGFLPL